MKTESSGRLRPTAKQPNITATEATPPATASDWYGSVSAQAKAEANATSQRPKRRNAPSIAGADISRRGIAAPVIIKTRPGSPTIDAYKKRTQLHRVVSTNATSAVSARDKDTTVVVLRGDAGASGHEVMPGMRGPLSGACYECSFAIRADIVRT